MFLSSGIVVLFVLWYKFVYDTPNAQLVRRLCKNKSHDEAAVVKYFVAEGCLSRAMSDDSYLEMVYDRRDSVDYKRLAIAKIGLDEDEIREIPPVTFKGFTFNNAYAKQTARGDWVSSTYEVAWLFFSSTQVYVYIYSFNMDDRNKFESTREFFYKDITSFAISTETEEVKSFKALDLMDEMVTSNKLTMIVPGDTLLISLDNTSENEKSIQGMKFKLREKKQS